MSEKNPSAIKCERTAKSSAWCVPVLATMTTQTAPAAVNTVGRNFCWCSGFILCVSGLLARIADGVSGRVEENQ